MERRKMEQYSHGDVLIYRISDVPKKAKKQDRLQKDIILAEGEVTGHTHRVAAHNVDVFEKNGITYLQVKEETGAKVTHEEHDEIVLSPGSYDIRIAREYDHFAEEARQVAD